jgi:hypothetical protein
MVTKRLGRSSKHLYSDFASVVRRDEINLEEVVNHKPLMDS